MSLEQCYIYLCVLMASRQHMFVNMDLSTTHATLTTDYPSAVDIPENLQSRIPVSLDDGVSTPVQGHRNITLHLGVLIPLTGDLHIDMNALGMIPVAISRVMDNQHGQFQAIADHGGIHFQYSWRDTHCQVGRGLTALIDLCIRQTNASVNVLIGKFNHQIIFLSCELISLIDLFIIY